MIRSMLPLLLLLGCDPGAPPSEADLGAFELPPPPPGSGVMTLTGPTAVVSGDTVTFEVTAPDLQPGEQVELGSGTAEGPGMCPHRAQTGGSPCLDVTGRMRKLGVAQAVDDGGTVKAVFTLALTRIDPTLHLQAFFLNGASSATSNVLSVEIGQPWPELDPRVEELQILVDEQAATIAAQAALIADLSAAVTAVDGRAAQAELDIDALEGVDLAHATSLMGLGSDLAALSSSTDTRFTAADLAISAVDNRLDLAEMGFNTHTTRLDGLDAGQLSLQSAWMTESGRIDLLESGLTSLQVAHSDLNTSTDSRFTSFEANLGLTQGQLDMLELTVASQGLDLSALIGSTSSLAADLLSLQSTTSDHGVTLTTLTNDLGMLTSSVAGLSSTADDHQTRLTALEASTADIEALLPPAGALLGTLTTSTTIYVPSEYATVQAALDSLNHVRIAPNVEVTIQIADGTHAQPNRILVRHPDGARISLLGNPANADAVVLTFPGTSGIITNNNYSIGRIEGMHLQGTGNLGTGISAENSAVINIGGPLKVSGFNAGLVAADSSIIDRTDADPVTITGNRIGLMSTRTSTIIASAFTASNNLTQGFYAAETAMIWAHTTAAHDNGEVGYLATMNSTIQAHASTATGSVGAGFGATYGGTISAGFTSSQDNHQGFLAQHGSAIYALGAHASYNNNAGFFSQSQSSIYAVNTESDHNTTGGYVGHDSAYIDGSGASSHDNATYGVYSDGGGTYMFFPTATVTGNGVASFNVTTATNIPGMTVYTAP